jgi:hypothetical protein
MIMSAKVAERSFARVYRNLSIYRATSEQVAAIPLRSSCNEPEIKTVLAVPSIGCPIKALRSSDRRFCKVKRPDSVFPPECAVRPIKFPAEGNPTIESMRELGMKRQD